VGVAQADAHIRRASHRANGAQRRGVEEHVTQHQKREVGQRNRERVYLSVAWRR